jgi:hypothetical protein
MPAALRCRDLGPGDILLKVSDGSLLAAAIQAGQSIVGGANARIVHAGVLFDGNFVIEAQAAGIIANDLRVQDLRYGYHVFRCKRPDMAQGAGTCAKMMFDIHARTGSLRYSIGGAIGSLFGGSGRPASPGEMDALLDRILAGRMQPFFCSQFVVYVYQFVAEQCGVPASLLFDANDAKVEPSVLTSVLARSPHFAELGYLMPNAR